VLHLSFCSFWWYKTSTDLWSVCFLACNSLPLVLYEKNERKSRVLFSISYRGIRIRIYWQIYVNIQALAQYFHAARFTAHSKIYSWSIRFSSEHYQHHSARSNREVCYLHQWCSSHWTSTFHRAAQCYPQISSFNLWLEFHWIFGNFFHFSLPLRVKWYQS
jgi:hypothetical protein